MTEEKLPNIKTPRDVTAKDWFEEGTRLFGPDQSKWKFVCPVCKHVASVEDYRKAGAPDGAVAFSCIGRWDGQKRDAFRGDGPGPCNYTGGGLFRLNPMRVSDGEKKHDMFDFAREVTP